MTQQRLTYLIEQYIDQTATEAERRELDVYLHLETNAALFSQAAGDLLERRSFVGSELPYAGLAQRVLQMDKTNHTLAGNFKSADSGLPDSYPDTSSSPVVGRVHFLKTAWFRYAAALLLLAGTATFLYRVYQLPQQTIVSKKPITPAPVIPPGGNKATLTLSDGSTLVLDSAANGNLAQQGNTKVIKLNNGSLAYKALTAAPGPDDIYNTITTPRGGNYQVVLPDGSKVWLNASSSIRFPTIFNGPVRSVQVSGEVYFEVARDVSRIFKVKITTDNGTDAGEVEVLGTHFNISAYDDLPVTTTLLQGRVKVIKDSAGGMLKPGEQMLITADNKVKLIRNADMEEVVAWKNGRFLFKGASLKTIMQDIMRWYDVDVNYKGNIPDKFYSADLSRNTDLSDFLRVLEESGIHFRMNGKSLTVMP